MKMYVGCFVDHSNISSFVVVVYSPYFEHLLRLSIYSTALRMCAFFARVAVTDETSELAVHILYVNTDMA